MEVEPTFKQEMEKLEKGTRELESGRLDLDDALARFEEGVALTRRLRKRLDEAEGRIEQLLADGSTEPLDVE
jgi:exodeoxyribonuclease VII small subunit